MFYADAVPLSCNAHNIDDYLNVSWIYMQLHTFMLIIYVLYFQQVCYIIIFPCLYCV